ncbi:MULTISPECIES: hypothetical protein [unclassified Acinetobacter]|uniref:hypothetical protein n=1 Tax=unclassified Acinetobacter TaxID=196816 RepID=UPI00244A76D8|nr:MULTISPECIES: hypothetical protein [unclassified Acinetobacter]MDH0032084.1 hypothetical protein [Acinetobacter sp. GD04021]MDH0887740.1 hypothetical protein [Acinetobacter sp. GD03873]MDH1084088.1 hypothetical protein [Acinetobacter sp. GD03983]MDH2190985.1 hypothetical protein [Acinetobacter sp. GD03645]MDH2204600.1 hypothetical protein [Acinetobacter sp. GD03647]
MTSMVQTEDNINFEALFSFEVIKQHNDQNLTIMRRIALTPLTRSYEQLVNSTMESEQGGEAFLQVFQIANEYIQYLKDTLELAEVSVNRLAIVGQTCLQQMENE